MTVHAPPRSADNQIYYLGVCQGVWRGTFSFRITDRAALKRDRIGLKQRMLARGMSLVHRLCGESRIESAIRGDVGEGSSGVARNVLRISRFGITLYLLTERYTLDPDGTGVEVDACEQFGPIPFLFRNHKRHRARVHAGGLGATYDLPLLGTEWTADCHVAAGGRQIAGVLCCRWAAAQACQTR